MFERIAIKNYITQVISEI